VFENRFLRRIFGPKRDKVKGEWRKLHNEELTDMYSSPKLYMHFFSPLYMLHAPPISFF
jgi:hypothetical protein